MDISIYFHCRLKLTQMTFLKNIFLVGLIFGCFSAFSQVDNNALQDEFKVNAEDSSKVLFSFYNLNFLKNNEYFGNIATGYTLFGSQVNSKIAYIPNRYMRIEGGVFLRKDFGTPDFTTIAPTLTVKLQKNGYAFLFGNLEGSLNHKLIEPLYNYERVITNRLENGLQFKIDKKKIWLDTWIDWEKQEYQNSPFQEHITAGLSSNLTILETTNDSKTDINSESKFLKISIPIQAIISHKGGQIDADTTAIQSLANTVSGVTLDFDLSKKHGLITGIRSDNYYVYYKDVSPQKLQPYISGTGLYFNLLIKSKYNISLMTSYWQGDYFMAPRGGYLYPSVSSIYGMGNYTEDNRKLLILRLMYQKEILPDLYVDVRFEPYKNINNNSIEFSYGVYFSYKKDFSLLKVKPR